ncbi:MAG TPA: hypothetical protein VKA67_05205 [Verrucomicrobiae bacterium]|nr:hypothetical protein [Verrucomicrobiae bacterium]
MSLLSWISGGGAVAEGAGKAAGTALQRLAALVPPGQAEQAAGLLDEVRGIVGRLEAENKGPALAVLIRALVRPLYSLTFTVAWLAGFDVVPVIIMGHPVGVGELAVLSWAWWFLDRTILKAGGFIK